MSMDLSLPVAAGGPSVLGSLLRSEQAYLELLATKETLEYGIAFHALDRPLLVGNHQFREVWLEDAAQVHAAQAEVAAHFAAADVRCGRWALAEGRPAEVAESALLAAGFRRDDRAALALAAWPSWTVDERIRVLPARAMRAAFLACWEEAAGYLPDAEQAAAQAAANDRLDDHRMDAFVATVDKRPAGVVALFQVGDIGRICDLYVQPAWRRQGVATALLAHVVAMARRLTLRVVCIDLPVANAPGKALLAHLGFVDAGRVAEFVPADAVQPDYATW